MRQLPASVSFHIVLAGMKIRLQRKSIRHVYIRVVPPDGEVRVSAPWQTPESCICEILVSRREWIRVQKSRISGTMVEPFPGSLQEMDSLSVWGQAVPVHVEERVKQRSRHALLNDGTSLVLLLRKGWTPEERTRLVDHFYRQLLQSEIARILPIWTERCGLFPSFLGIRKMQTRWGSCHPGQRRVWLNLMLARYPRRCLEYVLVHELVHFLERGHNSHFYAHMDHFLPGWRETQKLLDFPSGPGKT